MHSRWSCLLLVCVLAGFAGLRATDRETADQLAGPPPGAVTGKVLDRAGHGIEGVKVSLKRGEVALSTVTDAAGEYCFCRVEPARDYILEIEKEGFTEVMEKDTYVGRLKLTVRNFILDPLAVRGGKPGTGGSR